ncbi:MAG: ice-binding family protein [Patescibacteria group bacterium]|jgi:hypothetical protein
MKTLESVSVGIAVLSFVFALTGPMAALAAGPAAVDLGTAGNFVILTKSGISTTGVTSITGDIGVSPIAASAITGFGLTMDVSNTFSTSALVTGKVYASDYTAPVPATMTTAISDMQTAYTDAAGRTLPTATELGAGNIGGMTLAPGLYKWGTNVTIPTDVTLSGGANDVWIFQVAQNLIVSSAAHVILSGGAKAANIFWQVAGQTTLGTTAVFNGNILDQTAIVLNTGAVLNGRALAQTAVTLDANSVTIPSGAVSSPTPTPAPTPAPASTSTVSSGDGSSGGGSSNSSGGSNLGSSTSSVLTQQQNNLANLKTIGISINALVKLPCLTNSASLDQNNVCKAVYYVGTDGKRHAFPNSKVYFSWYPDFSQVQLISSSQLATIPIGANATYKPGVKMVKFTTDPKVYAVDKGGVLRWIKTEAAAVSIYGSAWNKNIDDISDSFYANYKFGADISGLSDFNPATVQSSVKLLSDSLQM